MSFPAPSQPIAAASTASSAFTASKQVSRVHLVDGVDVPVDTRTVTVHVEQTQELRERQQILVSWTGAHPTGGIRPDANSEAAMNQEFPVVLLQCRGIDSTTVPVAKRLSRETCLTVFPNERYQGSGNNFPEFRIDRYAPPQDRVAVVGAPTPIPTRCSQTSAERWVPFVAASGKVFYGGPGGCAGQAPEAITSGVANSLALPPNESFVATLPDGTGSVKFQVLTANQNASLGCSASVACSLEVIPIEGISCDASALSLPPVDRPQPGDEFTAAADECLRNGSYAPGVYASGGAGVSDRGVSGALWWAESNWRNRISVPITFAAADNVCEAAAEARGSSLIYGSELMIQAATSWAPDFCLDPKRFPFTHVQVGEPQAANGINRSVGIDAGFIALPPAEGWSRPVVMAPTAVTGFAVGYAIDDGNKRQYTSLKLNARLLAKLLSMTYPAYSGVAGEDEALAHNPLSMISDPEFRSLNPGLNGLVSDKMSAATLLSISGGTDVMTALTSYIDEDPEARGFLDGKPDPWGTTVNPNYKGMSLPVDTWPMLDTFVVKGFQTEGINDCLRENPVPYLPLVAAPVARLALVTLSVQFAVSNSQVVCSQPLGNGAIEGQKLVAAGRQPVGYRFQLGIVPVADARRFRLDVADLQTQASASTLGKAFTDAAGRSFVGPTDEAMAKAMSLAVQDRASKTWPMPYATWRTNPAAVQAYPGTMLIYTAVPTSRLPKAEAGHYADFLKFLPTAKAASSLAPGYVPVSSAGSLRALAAVTTEAAGLVRAQDGRVIGDPAPTPSTPTPSPTPAGGTGLPSTAEPNPSSSSAPSPSPTPSATPAVSVDTVMAGVTVGVDVGADRLVIPLLLGLAAACALGLVVTGAAPYVRRRR
jgi:hypothetical protein